MKNGSLSGLADKVAALGEESVAQQIGVGVPTLQDIVKELLKPGREPQRQSCRPPCSAATFGTERPEAQAWSLTGTVRT